MLHQVTGHAGQQLMADTAKYYGVNVTGVETKLFKLFFGGDQVEKHSHKE